MFWNMFNKKKEKIEKQDKLIKYLKTLDIEELKLFLADLEKNIKINNIEIYDKITKKKESVNADASRKK